MDNNTCYHGSITFTEQQDRIRELELEFASQGVTLAARNSRIAELEAQLAEANKANDEAGDIMESVLTMIWHARVSEWLSKHGGRG